MRIARGSRHGVILDLLLLSVFLVLAYIFMVRRGYMKQVNSIVDAKQKQAVETNEVILPRSPNHDDSQRIIDIRIKKTGDARPASCRRKKYPLREPASIILDFFDYQFYDVKTTISSVLHRTPLSLIKEIIIVDDGSTLDYILKESESFVSKTQKVQLFRNEKKLGSAKSKLKGAGMATSDTLVFLDTNIICNEGWLQPLLDLLERKESTIAVPHYDAINDPVTYDYKPTVNNLISSFSWGLTIRMTQSKTNNSLHAGYDSPVMRGNAFAVKKKFFESIGALEDGFDDPGGEMLELSFRTWMCGGSIKILPCSRVGVLNLHDPVKVNSRSNIRRIASVWLKERKDLIFKTADAGTENSADDNDYIAKRRSMQSQLACKDFDWYLNKLTFEIATPSASAKYFGLLKCRTGKCARVGREGRLDLGKCAPGHYNMHSTEMIFEMDEEGHIVVNGKCLTTKTSAYVIPEECRKQDTRQLYEYTEGKQIRNDWSGFCLMHVTDPEKPQAGKRQIAMSQDCAIDNSDNKMFETWDFVPL